MHSNGAADYDLLEEMNLTSLALTDSLLLHMSTQNICSTVNPKFPRLLFDSLINLFLT